MRRIEEFCTDWYFAKTAELPAGYSDFKDACSRDGAGIWEAVTLPHTWNAKDGQDGGNDYYRGTCMYAKTFPMPEHADKDRVILEFSGAAMTAEVYLNGTRLARHEGGYSAFRVDITDGLKDDNLLCVCVENGVNTRVYPQKADFTFYGGIYRKVRLITVPACHFELLKDGTPGMKVTPYLADGKAKISVESWQHGGDAVRYTIWDAAGEQIACAEAKPHAGTDSHADAGSHTAAALIIEQPHLWDGTKDPYLYRARAELLCGGETADMTELRFGCRSIAFDPERGFLLNGREYPLRGVSRHQDRIGVGNALTEEMHREDMELIKEIGANTVRLAHYQHAQEFYDLCDEYGMVVWAEIPYITKHIPEGRENTLSQMRELITQCHHHPSIVCWGLSNEITASSSVDEDMLENHRLLNELCHRMDDTRPTTMAHAFMLETDSEIHKIPDIESYNLYFGWYLGELSQNDRFFDEYHEKYPKRIIGFSEYGADANPKFQTAAPERGDYTEHFQAVYHEHLLKCIEARPYLWATHAWNMFDFAADGRDEGGAHGLNQKGLVSFDRKHKKDAFYLYKAHWSGEPFVHICDSGYADRAEEVTRVKVYSNLPAVTLYADGKEIETKEGEQKIFTFDVAISGTHEIRAVGRACGQEASGEEYKDKITVRKVSKPNDEYVFLKEDIINWFDREELDISCYSIEDTMGDLMRNPRTAVLMEQIMAQARASRGDVAESTAGNENLQRMMAGMKVSALLKQAGEAVAPEQVKSLNAALQKIKKQ